MNPKREFVLVTGANGRIGTAMIQRLTGRFSDVVGFDRKASRARLLNVRTSPLISRPMKA
jgi:nucleoside-diphosphate-sugar epimerase